MTEINTSLTANRPAAASREAPRRTRADINRISGLASGINTQQMITSLLQLERRRLEPVESRMTETKQELDAFTLIKKNLNEIRGTATDLGGTAIWDGKLVESSNEDVVTATATAGARPGKHTLVVDRLALTHQLASQGFETPETIVGTGRFQVTIGEETPVSVVIDESTNSLAGLKDSINSATKLVEATLIKTGNKLKPYQLVLTSSRTGSEGRIAVEVDLQRGEAPSFKNGFEEPSAWAGVGEPPEAAQKPVTGTGASTAIIRAIGEFAGDEDETYTFTAVQSGVVGGENQLQIRWRSSTGRSGSLELDSFNYAPGEPIPVDQGINLLVSQGEIIVGDKFTIRARAEKTDLSWWLSEEDRAAAIFQPSPWQRQADFGTPEVTGDYTGEDDAEFRLTVIGSGQIGSSSNLAVQWERLDDGESGVLRVGRGYQPGSKMALADGLILALKPGVLRDGQVATFEVTAAEVSGLWWKSDEERNIPSEILNVTNFSVPEDVEEEELPIQPDFPEELGPRISSTQVTFTGDFVSDEAKVYTFTALRDGAVGTTSDLRLRWEDDRGNSGELNIGEEYGVGAPLAFDSGLSVAFGPGRVFKDDSFTLRTRTASIQPPQDALVRLGATELGGGLEITSTTNELDGAIDGVKLTLVSSAEKPVTITIKGDTEKATESVLKFAEQYNTLIAVITELTKFDQTKNAAGPLLGNRDLADIQNRLTELLINPVAGLDPSQNMVFTMGLKLNEKGLLQVDDTALRSKIEDDFGAVADLFRSKGETENSAVAVVGITEDTPSSPSGLPVEITQVATQGGYTTSSLSEPIVIDDTNDRIKITVDGRTSSELDLPAGQYTVARYARMLQNLITDDEKVGKRGVRVVVEGDRIRFMSRRFGERSGIAFGTVDNRIAGGVGLLAGEASPGQNVAGTIAGEPAVGIAQLLKAGDDATRSAGLRFLVTLRERQISTSEPEATVRVTKGVGSRIASYLDRLMDSRGGRIKSITDQLTAQLKDMDTQLAQLEQRIDRKRERLQDKFARLERNMASLKSQQRAMSGQLAGLGGGGGTPGLPGL